MSGSQSGSGRDREAAGSLLGRPSLLTRDKHLPARAGTASRGGQLSVAVFFWSAGRPGPLPFQPFCLVEASKELH